jgi:hypothetical protein
VWSKPFEDYMKKKDRVIKEKVMEEKMNKPL